MPQRTMRHRDAVAWSAAQRQEAFWTLVAQDVRTLVRALLEQALPWLCERAAGAGWHERSAQRRARRNGHYGRCLATTYGVLPVRVPRLRHGGLDCSLVFDRYQRRVADVDRVLRHAYLAGASPRATAELAEQLFGGSLSRQAVSQLLRWLDGELWHYRRRPIAAAYPVVQLDGMHLDVRGGDQLAVLVVGLREAGSRPEVLGFSLAGGEQCRELLWDLRGRGLEGVALFTSDGSGAIESALAEVYPEAPRQICATHRRRGLWARLGDTPQRAALVREAGRLFRCSSGGAARQAAWQWERRWWPVAPEAVWRFMAGLSESLMFYDLPERRWRKARTANPVERPSRTLRMRLRPLGVFYDASAAERALFGQLLRWRLIPEITQTT